MNTKNQFETIRKSSATAEGLFFCLATKKRNKSRTDMVRLFRDMKREGFKAEYKDYLKALKDLEEAGALNLSLGKNSIHAEWRQPLTYVGLVGLGEASLTTKLPTKAPPRTEEPVKKAPKFIIISEGASERDIQAALLAFKKGSAA